MAIALQGLELAIALQDLELAIALQSLEVRIALQSLAHRGLDRAGELRDVRLGEQRQVPNAVGADFAYVDRAGELSQRARLSLALSGSIGVAGNSVTFPP